MCTNIGLDSFGKKVWILSCAITDSDSCGVKSSRLVENVGGFETKVAVKTMVSNAATTRIAEADFSNDSDFESMNLSILPSVIKEPNNFWLISRRSN